MNDTPISLDSDCREQAIQFLRDLVEQAETGDVNAMSQLRESMQQCPSLISKLGGDLAGVAAQSLIDAIAGERSVWKEAIQQQMEQMRVELAGPDPSAIERLLVDRVVTCWLQVQHADFMAVRADDNDSQRRQDRAHRRFLSAIKTLANVRRLALPLRVDVNVAASVETKSAEEAHAMPPAWERASLVN